MKNRVKQVFACLLSILIVVVGITPMTNSVVNAETTTGLQFTSIKIVESETGTVVADLLNGETPKDGCNLCAKRELFGSIESAVF